MKNYYEILQVNENASQEIIEKAYRVLVKKYHPDLQREKRTKDIVERKLADVNEAYDVLSNEFLKEQYDLELKKERQERYKKMYGEQDYSTEKHIHYQQKVVNQTEVSNKDLKKQNVEETEKPQIGTIQSAIHLVKELYSDIPKRQEYKEMTKKDILAILLTIIAVIILGVILWFIPFTNGWMREILFENPISQAIGKLFFK